MAHTLQSIGHMKVQHKVVQVQQVHQVQHRVEQVVVRAKAEVEPGGRLAGRPGHPGLCASYQKSPD